LLSVLPDSRRAPRAALVAVVLAGLALRLVFVPVAGSRQDNLDFQRWGNSAVAEGFGGLYTRDALILNYPPAYLYPLALDGLLHRALTLRAGQPWPPAALDPTFFMLQKLNPILADLATAALLFFALRRPLGSGRALAGAAATALNPALIYTAGYWGQVDGVVLGLLVALFLAVVARRPVLAGVLGGLALAT
jgi:Gpi18-like mannosyltransferase